MRFRSWRGIPLWVVANSIGGPLSFRRVNSPLWQGSRISLPPWVVSWVVRGTHSECRKLLGRCLPLFRKRQSNRCRKCREGDNRCNGSYISHGCPLTCGSVSASGAPHCKWRWAMSSHTRARQLEPLQMCKTHYVMSYVTGDQELLDVNGMFGCVQGFWSSTRLHAIGTKQIHH